MNSELKLPAPDSIANPQEYYEAGDIEKYLTEENFRRGWVMGQRATVKAIVVWIAEHYLGSADSTNQDAFIFTKEELLKLRDYS